MKKLLYTLLAVSILSMGCSKEDDTNLLISNLEEDLYGYWLNDVWDTITSSPASTNYIRRSFYTFSSNMKFTQGEEWTAISGPMTGDVSYGSSAGGSWWVQDDKLFLDGAYGVNGVNLYMYSYNVSGIYLTLMVGNSSPWFYTKQ
jgi:hypothetical protein